MVWWLNKKISWNWFTLHGNDAARGSTLIGRQSAGEVIRGGFGGFGGWRWRCADVRRAGASRVQSVRQISESINEITYAIRLVDEEWKDSTSYAVDRAGENAKRLIGLKSGALLVLLLNMEKSDLAT